MTFRLSGTGLPDGQIGLLPLSDIADALQALATRIGRDAIHQRGAGRTYAAAEDVTRLRLVGLHEGSTTLAVEYGQPAVLDVDDGLESETRQRFEEVIVGLGADSRPGWTPDVVAESAGQVLEALARCVPTAEFTSSSGAAATIDTRSADRSIWRRGTTVGAELVTAVGHLEMVDLKSRRFRLRDDVGNSIALKHVRNDHDAARLIDQRVSATGMPERGDRGELAAVEAPALTASPLPAEWIPGHDIDWSDELAKPGPDTAPAINLSDDDFAAFLAVLKEQ